MNNLLKKYKEEVAPKLKEKFELTNVFQIPKVEKIVINIGVGKGLKDSKYIEAVENTLVRITGQKPIQTKAKKSISNFKIREGMIVGLKVTLRRSRMWDFLEKLVKVTLPRVRDFRGISSTCFDKKGNYTLGLKEHLAFPEIKPDEVELIHGLEISIKTSTESDEQAFSLLQALGFPFKEKELNSKKK